jgi:glycosyltransferase involved in cell wall biosynthesis
MVTDPSHSIAICNYNMAETLEESLSSIVEQVEDDDRFEVLVVDDGSSDGSRDILDSLRERYDSLRTVFLDYDPDRGLGETRNISFERANGEFLLESLDTDDRYDTGIRQFVEVFHQLDDQLSFDFYFQGVSIVMSRRDLLLDIPYRNLKRGQDADLRRRLLAADALLWVQHERFAKSIGYDPGVVEQRRIWFEQAVTDFQSGVTLDSYFRWALGESGPRAVFLAVTAPLAYLLAMRREQYDVPAPYHNKVEFKQTLDQLRQTLPEIEAEFDVEIDRDQLTERGREIFYSHE